MEQRERERIFAQCERFVAAWTAPRDPATMFRAMAERAGPLLDAYGSGESVKRLERRVAELLGKEAAVLFPSGTMAQQIALRIWCERSGCWNLGFHPKGSPRCSTPSTCRSTKTSVRWAAASSRDRRT